MPIKLHTKNPISDMLQSDGISLIVDESTDISALKQLVIYGRCAVDGELRSHFLGMRNLFNGTAEIIETSLVHFLQDVGLILSNVSNFGSDGARVMTGRQKYVATRLQRVNSDFVSIYTLCCPPSSIGYELGFTINFVFGSSQGDCKQSLISTTTHRLGSRDLP